MINRRGVALIGQGGTVRLGDPELSQAITNGVMAARLLPVAAPAPEQVEVVQAEMDRQNIERLLLRVAVGNDKTAEDYRLLTAKARADYSDEWRIPEGLRKVGRALLGLYGLIVYIVAGAYRSQSLVLGRREA